MAQTMSLLSRNLKKKKSVLCLDLLSSLQDDLARFLLVGFVTNPFFFIDIPICQLENLLRDVSEVLYLVLIRPKV